jgi:MoaA/NifB/PqqE/SkfB family radical SAM enzyme
LLELSDAGEELRKSSFDGLVLYKGVKVTVGDRIFTLTARGAVKAGIRLLPLISDDVFLRVSRWKIDRIGWQEGREFMQHLLISGKRALAESSEKCRDKAANNFFYNFLTTGYLLRREFAKQNGFRPPYLLVISPTMRCNLKCYGCYAGEYSRSELDLDTVVRLVDEGKRYGIYFIVISGGEPFTWNGLLDLFRQESDVYFQVYTNGSLIDDGMARELSELGNVVPCISVEGFEEETDRRRGKGHFKRIVRAMQALKKHGVIFGFSATATRANNEFIVSDEFVDFYEGLGCFIGWYFNYVPIGRCPDIGLMPTPEQRMLRRRRLVELRHRQRILLADFWNDGPLTGGCIAGGRSYLHINSNGDAEPCVFTHFAVDNIADKSLREILASGFFRAIREQIPYCENYLRPCMIIDHPALMRELIGRFGAHPTHHGADALLDELKDDLDRYAEEYGEIADAEWYGQDEGRPFLTASGDEGSG